MHSTSPVSAASMLSLTTNAHTVTTSKGLGRALETSRLAGQLIDVLATTISPLIETTSQDAQLSVTMLGSTNLAGHDDDVIAKPLDLFHDLFKHLATSADCAAIVNALLASFSVILVSELGDKTFIITAIMAMKNSRLLVFLSSALALLLMTILSVGMGVAVTVIPKQYTHYASIVLFLCFGLKMLKEAYDLDTSAESESEFEEVKKSLEVEENNDEFEMKVGDKITGQAPNQQQQQQQQQPSKTIQNNLARTLRIAPIVIKVFTMILVAEWGDRSQISTVILAARENVVGVFIGSFTGHILCTGLAVIGGRFVAEIISVRTMTLIGGLIFLFFATFAIVSGPE